MAEGSIIIKPEDLQKEIDNSRKTNGEVKALKYDIDKGNIHLQSMDMFLECLGALNAAIVKFAEITEVDLHSLEIVKATWMKLDEELASKTTLDRVTDAFGK
ncbi:MULTISPECIES: hypothetical protein [Clostridium]|uniref:Uncharacterized protein n=1 Tax=Clostridium frigoriphilum TaxID=443253 RepID=A0ABU7UPE0_9CLOT|nr:hypothetical protein [Clostridium sp. DSM 17811]MBU3099290.1 hypothetical protein [Clostridium sp. DSM 17811]